MGVSPRTSVFGEPERAAQARRRIGVDGQHLEAALGVGVGQQAGQRGLAHAALAGDGDLHVPAAAECRRMPRTASARRASSTARTWMPCWQRAAGREVHAHRVVQSRAPSSLRAAACISSPTVRSIPGLQHRLTTPARRAAAHVLAGGTSRMTWGRGARTATCTPGQNDFGSPADFRSRTLVRPAAAGRAAARGAGRSGCAAARPSTRGRRPAPSTG